MRSLIVLIATLALTSCATPKERIVYRDVDRPVAKPCVKRSDLPKETVFTDPVALEALQPDAGQKAIYSEYLAAKAELKALRPIAKVCSE